jgi:hypothetical protein
MPLLVPVGAQRVQRRFYGIVRSLRLLPSVPTATGIDETLDARWRAGVRRFDRWREESKGGEQWEEDGEGVGGGIDARHSQAHA